MWQEKVHFFNSRKEKLVGILGYPEKPKFAALLIGPHPQLGGDMDNNVMSCIYQQLQNSALSLRFNFHGSGESEISLAHGEHTFDYYERLEQEKRIVPFIEDTLAAYRYLDSCSKKLSLPKVVIGYSFGGYLSLLLSLKTTDSIVAIAPPLARYPILALHREIFCLMAEKDFLEKENFPRQLILEKMPDADHFFRKKETLLGKWVEKTIKKLLGKETI